jgi:hypothetical protein
MQTFEAFLPVRCVREPPPAASAGHLRTALARAHLAAPLEARLTELVTELELARAAVVASAAALRHQNCEIDADIARVLQRRIGDVLGAQIERTEELLAALCGGSRQRPV